MRSPTPTIFNLPLTDLPFEAILETAQERLRQNQNTWIVTINPEIALHARKNPSYYSALTTADLRVVDGAGLQLCSGARNRVTGVALTESFLRIANDNAWRVLIIARADGLSSPEQIKKTVEDRYTQFSLTIVTAQSDAKTIITELQPQLVLCSLGFPAQEILLAELQSQLRGTISIGIGGTFDFFTGAQKRAPKLFQRFGIEWLWRLIQQPTRIARIFRAVVLFPLTYLYDQLKNT